ncbi:MAG: putative cell wall binding repeat 2 [Chloroflexi bacterium]|nr:putative cell wall binding repeat 2 [Chloroflexota bacterium]
MANQFNRPSRYAVTAATLFGVVLGGGVTWNLHSGTPEVAAHVAQHSGAVTQHASAMTRSARHAANATTDFCLSTPPGQPSAAVSFTEYSTRLPGNDPAQKAVCVTRHTYTATQPLTTPNEINTAADRPWAVTLVTPDDPIAAISAVEIVHFPNDAPILFVNHDGIPSVTLDEIKRLGPVGVQRNNMVQAYLIGAAANPAVEAQLTSMGLKFQTVTAANDFDLANQIDIAYGKVQNPPTGVPQMETSATFGGNGIQDVFIGSTAAYQFMLPITHWVSHMPGAVLWVDPTSTTLPQGTIDALKRRNGKATIYVLGGSAQVPDVLFNQLPQYGIVTRLTNDDNVAFNQPPPITAESTAVAFSQMWDPMGMVGWNAVGAGHGFTIVNINDWQGAVGSAILSHLGFHAPLLLTESATALPADVTTYLNKIAPTFLVTPGDGPYNMLYIIGSYNDISWPLQVTAELSQEMGNRHDSPGGSTYIPPR